jgi:hypothetical protein
MDGWTLIGFKKESVFTAAKGRCILEGVPQGTASMAPLEVKIPFSLLVF